ncbi:EAL domain-containing protein [Planococcus faecalis]|uniref:EAL domain-containing protein n=1 Tax=Planococcus faecalis TaxID=1598147 RepID=UPI00210CB6E2|nr:EAL domain-containing protein [Planococcus faecalis]
MLTYYREKGFDYALDDVGEGYSTIEMLADLKPKYMKLDMKFVQDVAIDEEKQKVADKFLKKALEMVLSHWQRGLKHAMTLTG